MPLPEAQRRVVITGGPFSGKTTLIGRLARRGFWTVGECAIEVIQELTLRLGLAGQAEWRAREPERFQEMILARQRIREAAIPDSARLAFLDRGVHDGLAYLRHLGVQVSADTLTRYGPCHYHSVFVLETLNSYRERLDTGRTETRPEALRIRDRIMEEYQAQGVPTIFVPVMSCEAREEVLLRHLNVRVGPDSSAE